LLDTANESRLNKAPLQTQRYPRRSLMVGVAMAYLQHSVTWVAVIFASICAWCDFSHLQTPQIHMSSSTSYHATNTLKHHPSLRPRTHQGPYAFRCSSVSSGEYSRGPYWARSSSQVRLYDLGRLGFCSRMPYELTPLVCFLASTNIVVSVR